MRTQEEINRVAEVWVDRRTFKFAECQTAALCGAVCKPRSRRFRVSRRVDSREGGISMGPEQEGEIWVNSRIWQEDL